MITLYGYGPNIGLPDPSPFVLKVDCFLRMAGLEFQHKSGFGYLQKSPKGKLPFIEDKGRFVADSSFIAEYLTTNHDVELDNWLSDEQKATAYLIGKSIDENLYWCLIYGRWIREDSWPVIKEAFFSKMPFPLKFIAPIAARKNVKDSLYKQGLGRHTDTEIAEIARNSFENISTLLGEKDYIFGERPCSLDATLYAFLAQAILSTATNPISDQARQYPNLVRYCERIQEAYYSH